MKKISCIAVFLILTVLPLAIAQDGSFKVIEEAQGVAELHLFREDKLGVEIFCNRKWEQETAAQAVMMVISRDPAVLLTVGKATEPVTGVEELTEEHLKLLGQYADGFKVEPVTVGGDPAVRVEGYSEQFPEMRLMDFYVVHDYALYSFLFSVDPKEDWGNYTVLFEKIVESIKIDSSKS